MENSNGKNIEKFSAKHPEPSENVQLSIETVIPDTENLLKEKTDTLKQKRNNDQKANENEPHETLKSTQDSSAEQDNNIETVTP